MTKIITCAIDSEYQRRATDVQVLLPDRITENERLPALYLLPVEAGYESHYGDPVAIAATEAYADRYRAIFVCPRFEALPWYADHPNDAGLRQESYLIDGVLPYIENRFPALAHAGGRHLIGFSKSGWGAFSLLLRHPDVFGTAAVFDAPLMLDRTNCYDLSIVFPTPESFDPYTVPTLLRERVAELGLEPRLALGGSCSFGDEMRQAGELMTRLGIPYVHADTQDVEHVWDDRWMRDLIAAFGPFS